jgi:hypothetical protein
MKFVVECANFCPRVLYIPDEDVPQDVLDTLIRISDEDGMIIMEHDQISKNMRRSKDNEANRMAGMLLIVYDNLTSSMGGYEVPDWTRNASTTNHRSFNTNDLAKNCDFYFVEDSHLDQHNKYIEPVHNNVNELLLSYFIKPRQENEENEENNEENEDQSSPLSPETEAPTD